MAGGTTGSRMLKKIIDGDFTSNNGTASRAFVHQKVDPWTEGGGREDVGKEAAQIYVEVSGGEDAEGRGSDSSRSTTMEGVERRTCGSEKEKSIQANTRGF
ncbi:hypothetical protein VMCG_08662 [Cytospora schulzeri]|uniref:Uncharacterized protein n=1 Tax=Cytospora schulzeri TaxID=448051 RepID=A0A423VTI1_9PEZI|nr:hypothetical protein VMCG_08662 [Valsa malicola]